MWRRVVQRVLGEGDRRATTPLVDGGATPTSDPSPQLLDAFVTQASHRPVVKAPTRVASIVN